MRVLERLGLVKKSTVQEKPSSSPQADMRQASLTRTGSTFFKGLDSLSQQRVSEIFAAQDEDGLKKLLQQYDTVTIEAISLALDEAVQGVIGEDSSYHDWATGVLQSQEKQLFKE